MTDTFGSAGDHAYDELPPYDPYAGWDAPAPYIKEVPPEPAQPDGMAEAIAAGLLPDPSQQPAAGPASVVQVVSHLPHAAPAYPVAPSLYTQPPAHAPAQPTPVPLTLMPKLPEMELPEPGRAYQLATVSQRARAMTIDTLILAIPTCVVLAMVMPKVLHAAGHDKTLTQQVYGSAGNPTALLSGGGEPRLEHWILVAGIVASVIYWGVLAVYTGYFMSRTGGQTPGRRAAGIRVMRADGGPITFGWAVYRTVIVREVVFGVASLFTFGLATLAQYGWSLWDHDRRSLHDMIARSRVVVDAARTP